MKNGAIFDMDGLLFDTERLYQESWQVIAHEWGFEPSPDFPRAVCGTNGEHMREVVRSYYPQVDTEKYIAACLARVERCMEQEVREKPGVHEILAYLREQGWRVAVASSSAARLIESNLRRTGIDGYFDAIVSGEQVGRGKPEPDIFLEAARRLGLAPADCYVFEDGINGIRAGLAAGCKTVMIPDLTPPTDAVRQAGVRVYDSLLAALDALQTGAL